MQEEIIRILQRVSALVWGTPMLVLLVGTGIYLTLLLRGIQFTVLYPSLRLALIQRKQKGEGDISHFQALMTALSATVGTGNITAAATGLGSAPIAAAAAQTPNPVTQALVSMTQTFIDTLAICTLTGLAILTSGAWNSGETGSALSALAFSTGPLKRVGGMIVSIGLVLFAYSTLIGWSYYREKAVEYLFGGRSVTPYRVLWVLLIALGAVVRLDLVWTFADIMNGLMAVPNLIGLLVLSPVILQETLTHLPAFLHPEG